MPTYNNALTNQPANRLAFPSSIGPVPRNEYLGALSDFLAKSYSPERTQQMQGISQLLGIPAVSRTLDMMSYGDPLTTGAGGLGGTTRVKPDVLEAAMTVAPLGKPATMATLQAARLARQAALAGKVLPIGMSTEAVGGMSFLRPSAPQQAALDLAQQNAAKAGQSLDAYPRSLQQGYEHDWYHGSTGDIKSFNPSLLGEATGAASAKKGFFFARDPQNPPKSMLTKTTDQASIDMLKRLGKTDEEIAALNAVSMQGHGAETASGYAQIGGSREYRDATRKAKAAEKRGDWDEYEKQAQIAEDSEIKRMNYAQDLTAKYGDRRDEMLDAINNAYYSKKNFKLSQPEHEALDAKYKELMPYNWYNSFDKPQIDSLKTKLVDLLGEDGASSALKKIDEFQSVKNERALAEKTQEGSNVMPVALRYKNPLVYDFAGNTYRDQTYSDLVDQAMKQGNDAVILKNTFDPAAGPSKLIDVGVVFEPNQIRSKFAAFNPENMKSGNVLAGALPFSLLADEENRKQLESYGLLAP